MKCNGFALHIWDVEERFDSYIFHHINKIGEVKLKEIWKPLIYPLLDNKYNHYEISSFGNLRNTNTNKILKPSLLRTGYYSVER